MKLEKTIINNEGFGSYYLKNVFAWKDEYFVIVKGE